MFRNRYLATIVMVLGVASLALGGAFIGIALQKNNLIVSDLKAQNVTLGLTAAQIAKGDVVDNAAEAQVAANTLAEHLSSIAKTYTDLMAANPNGRYDPTNSADLSYTQGLNMENSFNLVVLGFGVIQETEVTGATLAIVGTAIIIVGAVLFRKSKKSSEPSEPAKS
jgi:hypothetical protein